MQIFQQQNSECVFGVILPNLSKKEQILLGQLSQPARFLEKLALKQSWILIV